MNLEITSLLSSYRNETLTPREVVNHILATIDSIDNPDIWIHRMTLEEIEPYLSRLETVQPEELPLYGIPFAIKDNIDLEGIPTTAACPEYSYVPDQSAFVVENLIRKGAIPIGKTNLDQFATGLVGVRSPYGTPRNPLAPDRVPGGSSSGSAVALSEGLVSFSLGTDTAGSGRIPAAFNQLWGVKPSRGRLSTRGVVPACRTLDCVSIFALNGDDAEIVLKVAEGYDTQDPYSQATINRTRPSSTYIGVPQEEQLLFFGDANYKESWLKALEKLRSKGWKTKEIEFEPFLQSARLLYEGPWVSERTTALRDFLATNAHDFHPTTRSIVEGGKTNTACDAYAAIYKLAELRRASESLWNDLAAIVTPTAGGFPRLSDLELDPLGPNSQLGYYTNFMNLLDLCALATPAGESSTGLPFGITWIAPRDCDRTLLDFARNGPSCDSKEAISIVLFGAHMRNLPLNYQVIELGGEYVSDVKTADLYKMIYLESPAPHRPGIVRVNKGGYAIKGEEWLFPKESVGTFLSSIHQPLGLGEISLSDGRKVHGFLCEEAMCEYTRDISTFGGWRAFLSDA